LPAPVVGAGGEVTADAAGGELVIQGVEQLVELGCVLAVRKRFVAANLGGGPGGEPELLRLIRRGGGEVGFVVEVPAVAALLGPQRLGSFRARRADVLEGGAAGQQLIVNLAGRVVGAAELDGPDASACGFGQVTDGGGAQGHGQALGAGDAGHRAASP